MKKLQLVLVALKFFSVTFLTTAMLVGLLISCSDPTDKQTTHSTDDGIDRTILPIQPPKSEPVTVMDARNV